jgi:hypothetical protein
MTERNRNFSKIENWRSYTDRDWATIRNNLILEHLGLPPIEPEDVAVEKMGVLGSHSKKYRGKHRSATKGTGLRAWLNNL